MDRPIQKNPKNIANAIYLIGSDRAREQISLRFYQTNPIHVLFLI
jgi:hypothetical protein